MFDDKVQAARLRRTECTAVIKHDLWPMCKDYSKRKLEMTYNFLFVDKATVKAGEISYFGKHPKVVTIFYIPNLLTLCNIGSACNELFFLDFN